jgi:hypothetical protein
MRESNKFEAYIYRKYALRRIRDAFRENKNISDETVIENLIKDGQKNLAIIKRQVIINQLYKTDKLVIEKKNNT